MKIDRKAAYEMSLTVRLIVKGFNSSAISYKSAKSKTNDLLAAY